MPLLVPGLIRVSVRYTDFEMICQCASIGLSKAQADLVKRHWNFLNERRAAETTDRFSALKKVQVLQLV